jgi:hypothetical protein
MWCGVRVLPLRSRGIGVPSSVLSLFSLVFVAVDVDLPQIAPTHSTGEEMRKLRNVAVLVAALGTIGLAGGTAHADGGKHGGDTYNVTQSSQCRSHDLNLDVLGQVNLLGGALGNALNGEGNPGAQYTHIGSTQGCNNSAF